VQGVFHQRNAVVLPELALNGVFVRNGDCPVIRPDTVFIAVGSVIDTGFYIKQIFRTNGCEINNLYTCDVFLKRMFFPAIHVMPFTSPPVILTLLNAGSMKRQIAARSKKPDKSPKRTVRTLYFSFRNKKKFAPRLQ
jgi:hypothetical protein